MEPTDVRQAEARGFPFGQDYAWRPDPAAPADTNLHRFMRRYDVADYAELMRRSTQDVEWFWTSVLDDLGISFYRPYDRLLDLSEGPAFPRWCVGGEMNIVHNLLDRWQDGPVAAREALRWEGEEGTVRVLTYADLHRQVGRCANALRSLGVGRGDVVGLFMPMTPELVIAFLATAKVGAIILPLFSGYGAGAVASRLRDAQAKVLFTADGFWRRGKAVGLKGTADEALVDVPSVEHVVVYERLRITEVGSWVPGRDHWWHDLVDRQPDEASTERTEAEAPLMILYTSGTTGRPKGALHTHCGFPIKAAQDMYQSMDLRPGEVMYWMTDMGWMMGPWLVFGTLLIGATMVIYDGAPDFPGPDRLWQLAAAHGVTHLGVSPSLVRALMAFGTGPLQGHDLSRLRAVGSTGSPWDPDSWQWVFEHVLERRKPILNYSGGTEISGGILCGNFLMPLKPCGFSGPVPGMAADVVDEQGRSVRGAVGELVLRAPWIGMTRGFWQDRDRYLDTYWSRFDGVWVHGDFAAVDDDGQWFILGRSDDTIKVAGKRLGPSEVEVIVCGHEAVAECAAIAVPHPVKGDEVVVFAVLQPPAEPDDTLRATLMQRIVDHLGKALCPRDIRFVRALPKTRNAKVMRRIIRAAYLGQDPGDVSSLEDPGAVTAIRQSR